MIYLPLHMLKPDMLLARDIPSSNLTLQLMVAGQRLNAESISYIEKRGIQGAYIENALSDGIDVEPFIEPEMKNQLLGNIKSEFDKSLVKKSAPDFKAVSALATSIVMCILEKDSFLFNIIDIRDYDNYTYSHSLYVGMISVLIGANMDLPPATLTKLAQSGLLHDIGKLDIPLEITNKPGALSPEEFEIMKHHPTNAVKRLRGGAPYRISVLHGIESHHEQFDGSGYPRGMVGADIPLFGRILAIADVYDALSSNRSYRKAWAPNRIIDYITSRSGTHFDPEILPAFLRSVSAFPVGTLVRLSDGSIAIVTKNNPDFILRPSVRILNASGQQYVDVDLSKEYFNITVLDTLENSAGGL